jgi:hypothetical protein
MMNAPTCPTCDRPIRGDDSVYFWPDRQTMEPLECYVFRRRLNISAEAEASASSAYGLMS